MAFAAGAPGLTLSARRGLFRGRVAALALSVALAACGRAPVADDVSLEWSMRPGVAVVGEPVVGAIRVVDRQRQPVRVKTVHVEAHMRHPGMAPVVANGIARGDGVHEVQLRFTMAGDWVLRVSGDLADGRRLESTVHVRDVQPSG